MHTYLMSYAHTRDAFLIRLTFSMLDVRQK